jgi:hypothetical protein
MFNDNKNILIQSIISSLKARLEEYGVVFLSDFQIVDMNTPMTFKELVIKASIEMNLTLEIEFYAMRDIVEWSIYDRDNLLSNNKMIYDNLIETLYKKLPVRIARDLH